MGHATCPSCKILYEAPGIPAGHTFQCTKCNRGLTLEDDFQEPLFKTQRCPNPHCSTTLAIFDNDSVARCGVCGHEFRVENNNPKYPDDRQNASTPQPSLLPAQGKRGCLGIALVAAMGFVLIVSSVFLTDLP